MWWALNPQNFVHIRQVLFELNYTRSPDCSTVLVPLLFWKVTGLGSSAAVFSNGLLSLSHTCFHFFPLSSHAGLYGDINFYLTGQLPWSMLPGLCGESMFIFLSVKHCSSEQSSHYLLHQNSCDHPQVTFRLSLQVDVLSWKEGLGSHQTLP